MGELFLTFILLASGIVINKCILLSFHPLWFVALRMSLTGIVLTLYNTLILRSTPLWQRMRQDLPHLLLISLLTTLLPALMKSIALQKLSMGKYSLLSSIDPCVAAFYSYWFLGERPPLRSLIAIGAGCLGMGLILVTDLEEAGSWAKLVHVSLLDLGVMATVFCTRFGWMRASVLLREQRYQATELNQLIVLISGLAATIAAYLNQTPLLIGPPMTSTMLLGFLYSILISNVLGYTLYARLLRVHSATTVSLGGFLVPLFVNLSGIVLFGEWPSMAIWGAGALILLSLLAIHKLPAQRATLKANKQ